MEDKPRRAVGTPARSHPRAPAHVPMGIAGDLSWDRGRGDGQAAWLPTSISSRPCKRLPLKARSRRAGMEVSRRGEAGGLGTAHLILVSWGYK